MQKGIIEVHEEGGDPLESGPEVSCCISALGLLV
jgi:hypothetical protein